MAGKGREYEFTFRLDGEVDAGYKQAMDSAAGAVNKLEKELKQMESATPFRQIGRDADKAQREISGLAEATGGFNDALRTVAEYTGAFSLINAAADSVKGIFGTMGEYEDSVKQVQVATGMTAKDMAEIESTMKTLYNQNLGESFADLSNALSVARQVTKAQGTELETLTKNAIVYRDVFGEDFTESVRTVDTMVKNFGITSTEAFNLLSQGAQQGLDKSKELLDTANEYSPYFAKLGFSANQMFDTFAAGLEAGAFNLDKVGDGIKEFGIRTKDGSKASMEAYQTIGLNGEKMTAMFGAGALEAQEAFLATVKAINELEDPVQKNAAAVQLFGTQAEDLEARVIQSFGSVQQQFDMTKNTMQEIAAIKYDSLSNDFRKIGRELMTEFVMPIAEDLMPTLKGLAEWVGDNRGLIENLALIVPGAMAAKGAANIVKSFGKIDDAAQATAGGVGAAGRSVKMLGSAVGLLGGPVGVGITALSALTFGVMEYRRQQEAARQALLNMGVDIEKAYSEYRSVTEHTKKVDALIKEYDQLNAKVKDAQTPTAELETARARLLEVEQQLIDLNPDILRAEDAKSGRFREQLGLVQRINAVRTETEKRDLEKSFIDSKANLPTLEKEYKELVSNAAKYVAAYDQARESYVQYQEYANRQQAIVNNPAISVEEMQRQLSSLAAEIEKVTGKSYGLNWANMMSDTVKFKKEFDNSYDSSKKAREEIGAAEQSFQSIYATSKAYIELGLDGTIEETAKKFNHLSEEGKASFNEALRKISELNREMDLLPAEKKVNVKMMYEQTGQPVPATALSPKDVPLFPDFSKFSLPQFGDGGITDRPSIFAERGLEAAIPIDNRPRSHAILNRVNQMMGHDSGGGEIKISYAPSITIPGGGPDTREQVSQALKADRADFERWFREMMRDERRLSFR